MLGTEEIKKKDCPCDQRADSDRMRKTTKHPLGISTSQHCLVCLRFLI